MRLTLLTLFLFAIPVFVHAAAPQILLFDTQTQGPFYQGQTVVFNYQICDPDNDVEEAFLAYGDGKADAVNFTNCQNSSQSHIFQSNGFFPVTLTVKDKTGAQTSKTKDIIVLVNYPPEIKKFAVGPKSVFSPGGTVFFEISVCPPDKNDAVAGFIDFGDGTNQSFSPTCNLSDPTIIAHQYFSPGNYLIKLIAQDSRGLRSEKTISLSIKSPPSSNVNFPPEIKRFSILSKSQLFSGGTVFFEINVCDPNKNDFVAANIDFGDKTVQNFTPNCDFSNPTIIPHQYFAPKIYFVKLTVQDQAGLKSEKVIEVSIKGSSDSQPNFPPEIKKFSLSPKSQLYPNGISYFEINVCDPNKNDAVAANLDFGDGTNQSFTPNCNTTTPSIIPHQYILPNVYKAKLKAKDEGGLESEKLLDVVITIPGNRAPIAQFSFVPSTPLKETVVYFIDKSNDNDKVSFINSWTWDFGDGFTSNLQHPTHVYAKSGNYKVTLTVKDNGNLSSKTERIITIKEPPNLAPTANFSFTPQSPAVNQTVYFIDKSFDNDQSRGGYIKSWNWSFGDGSSSNLQHPTKVYLKGGNYTVKLKVTDNEGLSATASQNVYVYSASSIKKSGGNLSDDQIQEGDLVKLANSDKIWHITQNKRHLILNEKIFSLYGFSFDDVKVVSPAKLLKFNRANLLKAADSDKIYYLHEDGRKRLLNSWKVFYSYGNKLSDVLTVLPEEIESYPDVVFIKLKGSSKIFMIKNNRKFPIIKPDQNIQKEAVIVNRTEFDSYLNGPPID